jgi:hypothetical protein
MNAINAFRNWSMVAMTGAFTDRVEFLIVVIG